MTEDPDPLYLLTPAFRALVDQRHAEFFKKRGMEIPREPFGLDFGDPAKRAEGFEAYKDDYESVG